MSTLLRDVIRIPERAGDDDYVLRLTEGVGAGRLAATVDEYVVTDAIADAFDQALGLVGAAVKDRQSKAAFLAGSFGSGKSHFMAVLHALLGHDPAARSKELLAPVIARHDRDLADRKILRLAYHFLDSRTVEETVLGRYVTQIQALHPDCDLPAVHKGDQVLHDGEGMRDRLGDDAFFAELNKNAAQSHDTWSAVLEEETWNAESYDAARAAEPGSEKRQGLVSALVRTFFKAYTQTAEFVPLDEGLDAITRHAKSLGYDAVVMFLDELVLWLAFSVRDQRKFGQEAQKLTKLVEAGSGERAIPVVSFVARQMDLRRYFATAGGAMGAEQEALDSAFRHQEGRFATIELGDENIPYVAEKRLLRPVDDAARDVLDDAFERLERRPEVWDVLLDGVNTDEHHRGADQVAFRRTYPFSPALVSTLRDLASVMQRDRTALKVMQKLLVDQRDTLTVDDVVPVGDVFDVVVQGTHPLDPKMRERFVQARRLYEEKLRPVLLRENQVTDADVASLPPGHQFRADDRLVKTLLLSALAPTVPALKELTAGRLAALNHGSIVSPLQGQEATIVLAKVRRWSGDVPEIHVNGDSRNPVIRVRIAEVDYESVIEAVKGEDNHGRRREMLKKLVWEQFDVADLDGDVFGVSRQNRVWRGSRREVEIVFGNVRDRGWLTDAAFEAGSGTWRFVVDYPFDEDGRSVREDLARLDDLRAREIESRTVVWLPHFLSRARQDELGRLVILDWLLGGPGERWTEAANRLSETDRVQAKTILENLRDTLTERVRAAVQQAYGAGSGDPGAVDKDPAHDRILVSLDPAFQPAAPVGHDLGAAFGNLVEQAFTATYPGHPRFEPENREVRPVEIAAVLNAIHAAHQDRDGRAFVEPKNRDAIRGVANPLRVGYMGETHFLFGRDRFRWATEFSRAIGIDDIGSDDPVTVRQVRQWIANAEPPVGLRPEIADLVVCAWAVLENRGWYRYGAPLVPAPTPGKLPDEAELRAERLPAVDDWTTAVTRAGALFGVVGNPYLTGASVGELTEQARQQASGYANDAASLVDRLADGYRRLGLPPDGETGRLATAVAARDLVGAIRGLDDRVRLVETLARTAAPATDQAVSRSLGAAATVASVLSAYGWNRLQPLLDAESGTDERGRAAKAILDRLRAALTQEELAQPLAAALKRADDEAFAWAVGPKPPPPPPTPARSDPDLRGSGRVSSPAELAHTVDELRAFVEGRPGRTVVVEWRVEG